MVSTEGNATEGKVQVASGHIALCRPEELFPSSEFPCEQHTP